MDAVRRRAYLYVDTDRQDAAESPRRMGRALAIIATTGAPAAVAALMAGLAPQGRLVVLGAGKDPLSVSTGFLVGGECGIMGSITGSPCENEKALKFSVLTDARPRIEVMPLEQASEACLRMKSGDVKSRMVRPWSGRLRNRFDSCAVNWKIHAHPAGDTCMLRCSSSPSFEAKQLFYP